MNLTLREKNLSGDLHNQPHLRRSTKNLTIGWCYTDDKSSAGGRDCEALDNAGNAVCPIHGIAGSANRDVMTRSLRCSLCFESDSNLCERVRVPPAGLFGFF
ncbi:hypothetical protein [Cupriavidus necator]|uniref:hypothetical protein n=1 Tax=Cupriavidus necator TaxID=106590 RepID=UPI00339D5809